MPQKGKKAMKAKLRGRMAQSGSWTGSATTSAIEAESKAKSRPRTRKVEGVGSVSVTQRTSVSPATAAASTSRTAVDVAAEASDPSPMPTSVSAAASGSGVRGAAVGAEQQRWVNLDEILRSNGESAATIAHVYEFLRGVNAEEDPPIVISWSYRGLAGLLQAIQNYNGNIDAPEELEEVDAHTTIEALRRALSAYLRSGMPGVAHAMIGPGESILPCTQTHHDVFVMNARGLCDEPFIRAIAPIQHLPIAGMYVPAISTVVNKMVELIPGRSRVAGAVQLWL